jgi:hypothetical protein
MGSLESRIANLEARVFPEKEMPHIVYVVHETDSEFEKETIRERAIAEYETQNDVEIDPKHTCFICLEIVYAKR